MDFSGTLDIHKFSFHPSAHPSHPPILLNESYTLQCNWSNSSGCGGCLMWKKSVRLRPWWSFLCQSIKNKTVYRGQSPDGHQIKAHIHLQRCFTLESNSSRMKRGWNWTIVLQLLKGGSGGRWVYEVVLKDGQQNLRCPFPPTLLFESVCVCMWHTPNSLRWFDTHDLLWIQQNTVRRKKHNMQNVEFYAFIGTNMWIYNEIKRYFSWKY